MLVLQAEKPVCLLCHEVVSFVKEYNLISVGILKPNTEPNMTNLASRKNSRLSKIEKANCNRSRRCSQ